MVPQTQRRFEFIHSFTPYMQAAEPVHRYFRKYLRQYSVPLICPSCGEKNRAYDFFSPTVRCSHSMAPLMNLAHACGWLRYVCLTAECRDVVSTEPRKAHKPGMCGYVVIIWLLLLLRCLALHTVAFQQRGGAVQSNMACKKCLVKGPGPPKSK